VATRLYVKLFCHIAVSAHVYDGSESILFLSQLVVIMTSVLLLHNFNQRLELSFTISFTAYLEPFYIFCRLQQE
jgi:hypothetical protein